MWPLGVENGFSNPFFYTLIVSEHPDSAQYTYFPRMVTKDIICQCNLFLCTTEATAEPFDLVHVHSEKRTCPT